MPTTLNDPNNRPHPPPPPPDTNGGPNVPKAVKKAGRNCVQRAMSDASDVSVRRPDYRRVIERGSGHRVPYDPNAHYPYPSMPHPPGSHQPGGGHHPLGGPIPGYGPSKYPAAGIAPQTRQNPVASYPSSSVGGYNQPPGVLIKSWGRFMMNQRVHVNVIGKGWLVGHVVAIIEGLKLVTSSRVRVRYVDLNKQQREGDFENHPDVIRPCPETEYY